MTVDEMNREYFEVLYDESWKAIAVFKYFPSGPSEPEPVPNGIITMFEPGDIQVFMATNDFEDVTDRFERITGIIKDGTFSFRIRTLADKMSMRDGLLMIVANKLPDEAWGGTHGMQTGVAKVTSPRKPEFPKQQLISEWHEGPDGRYAVIFSAVYGPSGQLVEVKGYGASSDDIPWNWHYGFEIQGSIPLIP